MLGELASNLPPPPVAFPLAPRASLRRISRAATVDRRGTPLQRRGTLFYSVLKNGVPRRRNRALVGPTLHATHNDKDKIA